METTRSLYLSYPTGTLGLERFGGIHRIQEVSGKRRHTSVISVAVVSGEHRVTEVQPNDVNYQEYRSSGAGGQHRNKVATAIRATHLPTGTVACAEDSKSHHINRENAYKKLVVILQQKQDDELRQKTNVQRNNQIGAGTRPEASWNWTSWRDEVSIPGYGTRSMKQVLKGKFPF
jgi:protein subunit release factor A